MRLYSINSLKVGDYVLTLKLDNDHTWDQGLLRQNLGLAASALLTQDGAHHRAEFRGVRAPPAVALKMPFVLQDQSS